MSYSTVKHKRTINVCIDPRKKDGSSKINLKIKAFCYSDVLCNEMDCIAALLQDTLDEYMKGGD